MVRGKYFREVWVVEEASALQLLFCDSGVSDSLWPYELEHARLPCPPLSPRVYLNSFPVSRWCHPTISSSVTPFSSCPQSFPASASFPMSCLFREEGKRQSTPRSGYSRSSRVACWLGFQVFTALVRAQSLIRELRCCKHNVAKRKEGRKK